MELPICELRQPAPFVERPFFCQHTKLRGGDNLKTPIQCARCRWYATPCADPRPVPDWETFEPSTPLTRRTGLGDFVAMALAWVGIHKKLGGCTPCDKRQAKLNSFGAKVKRLISRA